MSLITLSNLIAPFNATHTTEHFDALCQATAERNAEAGALHSLHDMPSLGSIFYGAVISPKTLNTYDAFLRCLLSVGPDGNIEWIEENVEDHELQDTLAKKGIVDVDIVVLQPGEFLLPGFIDTHTVSR